GGREPRPSRRVSQAACARVPYAAAGGDHAEAQRAGLLPSRRVRDRRPALTRAERVTRVSAMPLLAASAYEIVMAVHIMAVVTAFGWTFALPIVYAVAAKSDPRSLPLLHRVELTVFRWMLNPVLVVILGSGIFMAS